MNEEQNPLAILLARFGLPLVVLVYYVTASQAFEYTADSTFLAFPGVHTGILPLSGSPSPLWSLLLHAGSVPGLDPELTSKVLSLVFSCFAIMLTYLFAVEVLGDRLLSLLVAFGVALQSWLLQLGPSGSAWTAVLALSAAALFFLLRNEYPLSAVFGALCTLVLWQAVALCIVLILDAILNSIEKRRGLLLSLQSLLLYTAVLSLWGFYAVLSGLPLLPVLLPFHDFPATSPPAAAVPVALALLAVGGIVALRRSGGEVLLALRTHAGVWLWSGWMVAAGLLWRSDLWILVFPALCAYGFWGLQEMANIFGRMRLTYTASFILAALMLAQSQLVFHGQTKPVLEQSITRLQQLIPIGLWLRAHVPESAVIVSDQPGVLGHYSGRTVTPRTDAPAQESRFLVAPHADPALYEVIYDPFTADLDVLDGNDRYVVWRKR